MMKDDKKDDKNDDNEWIMMVITKNDARCCLTASLRQASATVETATLGYLA